MSTEILICAGIAFAIILGFVLIVTFCFWLNENMYIDAGISTLVIVSFIIATFGVWLVRNSSRECKEAKLERRRIWDRGVVEMIEKLKAFNISNQIYAKAPGNFELMDKINEIIDKVNELDIKLQTVKFFTSDQEKAIKQLLELLGDEKKWQYVKIVNGYGGMETNIYAIAIDQ